MTCVTPDNVFHQLFITACLAARYQRLIGGDPGGWRPQGAGGRLQRGEGAGTLQGPIKALLWAQCGVDMALSLSSYQCPPDSCDNVVTAMCFNITIHLCLSWWDGRCLCVCGLFPECCYYRVSGISYLSIYRYLACCDQNGQIALVLILERATNVVSRMLNALK